MNRIRLLFAPENIGFVDKIAAALSARGFEPSADDRPASAALVVWSPAAAASSAILSAARAALARRVLVPVALGKAPPPPSFEHLWPMDLSGWSGREDDPRWRFVLDEVDLAVRRGVEVAPPAAAAAPMQATPAPTPSPPQPRSVAPMRQTAPVHLEDVFAEPQPYQAAVGNHPGPRVPRRAIAVGAGLLIFASALAFFAGGREPAPAPPKAAVAQADAVAQRRVVALLPPKNQPTDEEAAATEESAEPPVLAPALSLESAIAAPDPVAELPSPPEDLRDAPVPEIEGELTAPGAEGADPRVKPATIASLAEAATAEIQDPIAELARQATRDEAAEAAYFGKYFRDCLDCPDMAEIRSADATPSPAASPANDFAIGVREVTHAQWRACVAEGACRPAGAGGDSMPVTRISYADAMTYVAWLSGRSGVNYRLPSESEWDYAAVGGGGAPFSEGVAPDPSHANVRTQTMARGVPTPTGTFTPNNFGLYDMAGNVWEWTEDCTAASGAVAAATDVAATDAAPSDPCTARVVKGGAFDTPASGLADAYRSASPVEERRFNTGFRVARDLR